MRIVISANRYFFTRTTLDILRKNKERIQNVQVKTTPKRNPNKNIQVSQPDLNVPADPSLVIEASNSHSSFLHKPYRTINAEYILSSGPTIQSQTILPLLPQFRSLSNKLIPNEYLANQPIEGKGRYEDYPLQKLIHICLKGLQQQSDNKISDNNWQALEDRIWKLYRNPSLQDNTFLLYISCQKDWQNLQNAVLSKLDSELKYMTQTEQSWLFFTICQVSNKKSMPKLQGLKLKLIENCRKTKLPYNSLIIWAVMSALNYKNAANFYTFAAKISRSFSNIVSVEHLAAIMVCFEIYNTPWRQSQKNMLFRNSPSSVDAISDQKFMQKYLSQTPNHDTLWRVASPTTRTKLRMFYSYFYPQDGEMLLTNEEILQNLTPNEALKYIHWLWKGGLKQDYEIKSLYEGIDLQKCAESWGASMLGIDVVYYICWIELGLQINHNYSIVDKWIRKAEYIPRGLEWPLWNYLTASLGSKTLQKQLISPESLPKSWQTRVIKLRELEEKIKRTIHNTHRSQLINQQKRQIEQLPEFIEFSKFLHSVQLWNFQPLYTIEPLGLVSHFVHASKKIVIHCISGRKDCIGQGESTSSEDRPVVDNQMECSIQLLRKHLSFGTIVVNMTDFMPMSINDRIIWLQTRVKEVTQPSSSFNQGLPDSIGRQ